MNLKKRILSLSLACALLMGALAAPAGASGSSDESTRRAEQLASLGLFQGTGGGYQLDAVPTRIQGLVMLIRLLGLEDEALAWTEPSPFTDVGWGDNYVSYAYQNGLTNGTSATTFAPDTTLNANGYVTFLLRALGYSDANGDFSWSDALSFAAGISMMDSASAATLAGVTMNRGDMVDLSYAALMCGMKDGGQTLAQSLVAQGVFTETDATAAGVLGGSKWTYTYVPYDNSTISYEVKNLAGVTAHVFTVNTRSPKVEVHANIVNGVVGSTAPFSTIVNSSGGAKLVMNANFFNSSSELKSPIGHVIADGQLMYISSGCNCLGITADGGLITGRPGMFVRVKASSGKEWAAYEMNTAAQGTGSNLYSRVFGTSVTFKDPGNALIIDNGVITDYYPVAAGGSVNIPANGYVMFMGSSFTSTAYFQQPTVGESVIIEPYLLKEDPEGFQIENVVDLIAGGPRLVQDGAIYTELEPPFTEARFTTVVSPRAAAGISADGKLILVSVPGGAKIQQMRELMLALGCVDAINLDGGASCGMYYDGQYIATPGREITTTLQIHVTP